MRGGIGDGLLEWEGVIRVEDMNEMRTIYGTWVVTTPKLSFLHFVHEGEVFAPIPALEESTAKQQKARFISTCSRWLSKM